MYIDTDDDDLRDAIQCARYGELLPLVLTLVGTATAPATEARLLRRLAALRVHAGPTALREALAEGRSIGLLACADGAWTRGRRAA